MSRKKTDNRFKDLDGGRAFAIPLTLLRHENWTRLTPYGVKLILDLGKQYTGFNNGYLCCAWSLMAGQGWRSPTTLYKAMLECEHYSLIVRTQQGGINRASLHAFTWRRIDEKPEQPLDCAPTARPSNAWKEPRVTFVYEVPKRSRSNRARFRRRAA